MKNIESSIIPTQSKVLSNLTMVCEGQDALDLTSVCVRSVWAVSSPFILTVLITFAVLLSKLPFPASFKSFIEHLTRPFKDFLTLEEAEAIIGGQSTQARGLTRGNEIHGRISRHAIVVSSMSLIAGGMWLGLGSSRLVKLPKSWFAWSCIVTAIPWIYSALHPIVRPTATPPYDLFWLFVVKLAASALYLGGILYDSYVFGRPFPATFESAILLLDSFTILVVIGVILTLPLNVPSPSVDKKTIVGLHLSNFSLSHHQ